MTTERDHIETAARLLDGDDHAMNDHLHGQPAASLTPVIHRGIAIHSTDCGTWMWACDHHETADMAATLDEAMAQVDALLGAEVTP